MIKLFKI